MRGFSLNPASPAPPLLQALDQPGEFLLSDFSKMDRSAMLHVGFQALDAFQVRGGGGGTWPSW